MPNDLVENLNNPFEKMTKEMSIINEFIEVKKDLDALEKRKKKLSDKVKAMMIYEDVDKIVVGTHKLSITHSERKTVPTVTKDELVAKLIGIGKNYLLTYEIVPNVEQIMEELDAGNIDKSLVDKYIKITPITTLRCD